MIRADEAFDVALRFLADNGAAVAADVIKSLYLAVILADDDQRVFVHIVEKIVPGVRDLAAVASK
jgi:hypothetical protein